MEYFNLALKNNARSSRPGIVFYYQIAECMLIFLSIQNRRLK